MSDQQSNLIVRIDSGDSLQKINEIRAALKDLSSNSAAKGLDKLGGSFDSISKSASTNAGAITSNIRLVTSLSSELTALGAASLSASKGLDKLSTSLSTVANSSKNNTAAITGHIKGLSLLNGELGGIGASTTLASKGLNGYGKSVDNVATALSNNTHSIVTNSSVLRQNLSDIVNSTGAARNYDNSLKNSTESHRQFNSAAGDSIAVLGSLRSYFISLASVATAKNIFSTADAMRNLDNQVRIVTHSQAERLAVESRLHDVANKTLNDVETTTAIYHRNALAMEAMGASQADAIRFTYDLGMAMRTSGRSVVEQNSAMYQLSQAMGANKLQGQEFRIIALSMPPLLKYIAKEMGVTIGELKKLGAEGKITGVVIKDALKAAEPELERMAAQMPLTLGQAMLIAKNEYKLSIDHMLNATGGFTDTVGKGLLYVGKHFNELATIVGGVVAAAFTRYASGVGMAALANAGFTKSALEAAYAQKALAAQTAITAASNGVSAAAGVVKKTSQAATLATSISYMSSFNAAGGGVKGVITGVASATAGLTAELARNAKNLATTGAAAVTSSKSFTALNNSAGIIATRGMEAFRGQSSKTAGVLASLASITGNTAVQTGKLGAAALASNGLVRGLGGAFINLGGILKAHPLLALAGIIFTVVASTQGFEGAVKSLSDAIGVVGYMTADLIEGFGHLIVKTAEIGGNIYYFFKDMVTGSKDATDKSRANFGIFFENTKGGFVGIIQGVAAMIDTAMASIVVAFKTIGAKFENMIIGMQNKYNDFKRFMGMASAATKREVESNYSRLLVKEMESGMLLSDWVNRAINRQDQARSAAAAQEQYNQNYNLNNANAILATNQKKLVGFAGNTGHSTAVHVHIENSKGTESYGKAIPQDILNAITVAGKPLTSYKLTSGLGAARDGHTHKGFDYAGMPNNAQIETTLAITRIDFTKANGNSGGNGLKYTLADGRQFTIWHQTDNAAGIVPSFKNAAATPIDQKAIQERIKKQEEAFKKINEANQRKVESTVKFFESYGGFDLAKKYGIDPNLAETLLFIESGGNANAHSPAGAKGAMQLMMPTAQRMGQLAGYENIGVNADNIFDPRKNLELGIRYIKYMQDKYKTNDPILLAAGYNAGEGVIKSGRRPSETQQYVKDLNQFLPFFKNVNKEGTLGMYGGMDGYQQTSGDAQEQYRQYAIRQAEKLRKEVLEPSLKAYYGNAANEIEKKDKLPAGVLAGLISNTSKGDSKFVGENGGIGILAVKPSDNAAKYAASKGYTYDPTGVNPEDFRYNPRQAIEMQAKMLADSLKANNNDLQKALRDIGVDKDKIRLDTFQKAIKTGSFGDENDDFKKVMLDGLQANQQFLGQQFTQAKELLRANMPFAQKAMEAHKDYATMVSGQTGLKDDQKQKLIDDDAVRTKLTIDSYFNQINEDINSIAEDSLTEAQKIIRKYKNLYADKNSDPNMVLNHPNELTAYNDALMKAQYLELSKNSVVEQARLHSIEAYKKTEEQVIEDTYNDKVAAILLENDQYKEQSLAAAKYTYDQDLALSKLNQQQKLNMLTDYNKSEMQKIKEKWAFEKAQRLAQGGPNALRDVDLMGKNEQYDLAQNTKQWTGKIDSLKADITGDSELQGLKNQLAERNKLIEDAEKEGVDIKGKYAKLGEQVQQQYATQAMALQMKGYENLYGTIVDLTKMFAGEQSKTYRAMFAIQKGFHVATTLMANYSALAQAWASAPFPGNLLAVATTAAKTGVLQSMIEAIQPKGFAVGGYTGSGNINDVAGLVHNEEFVFNARATRDIGVNNLRQMASTGRMPNSQPTVNVYNNAGAKVRTEFEGNDLNVYVEDAIDRKFSQLASPSSHPSRALKRYTTAKTELV